MIGRLTCPHLGAKPLTNYGPTLIRPGERPWEEGHSLPVGNQHARIGHLDRLEISDGQFHMKPLLAS